jgi:hypothetical protein
MRIPPVAVVEELLRSGQAEERATSWFKTQKHNEHLCTRFEEQLHNIMECFVKFSAGMAYDIQGPSDRGTDVVLQYRPKEQTQHEFLAFQVKSYDDLKDKRYLQTLKAQESDTRGRFRDQLACYYIVLCTDAKEHKEKIREINNAFVGREKLTVIGPRFARTFLALTRVQIFASVQNEMRSGDVVFRKAANIASQLTPTEFAVLLLLTEESLKDPAELSEIEHYHAHPFLDKIYRAVPPLRTRGEYLDDEVVVRSDMHQDDSRLRFANDVDGLQGRYLELYASSGWKLDTDAIQPLSLLLMDARLRYDMPTNEQLEHLYMMFKGDWPLED